MIQLISRGSVPDEQRWIIYNKIAIKILPLVLAAYTIAQIDRLNVAFAKLQMADDLAMTDAMYGFGAGIFFIGYCLFEIPSNMILHKIGPRIWLARIMIVWGLLSAATMLVETPFQFYILRFLLGLAEAGFYPGALLYLTYWFPPFARGQATSILLLATSLAAIIGGPLAGAIMGGFDGVAGWRGWQWLYLLEGLPAVAMGFVVWFSLRNGPRDAHWLTTEQQEIVERDLSASVSRDSQHHHKFGDAFSNINIWCLVLANFCNLCTLYGIQFWLPSIIAQVSGTGLFATGIIAALLAFPSMLVLILVARRSDRSGDRRRYAAIGFAISAFGLLLAGYGGNNAGFVLTGLVIAQCGVSATAVNIFSLPATFVVGAAAATAFALITTLGNLAGYVSPYLIGVMLDATGKFSIPFFGMAALTVVGAAVIMLTPALRKARTQEQGTSSGGPTIS